MVNNTLVLMSLVREVHQERINLLYCRLCGVACDVALGGNEYR